MAGLVPWRPGFDHRPVRVGFVVNKVALGQVSVKVLRFSPVSVILPMLHIRFHLHVALTRRTKGRILGTFKTNSALSEIGEHSIEKYFYFFVCYE